MRWKVTGADGNTGREVKLVLEADTEDRARALAGYRGIRVAAISQEPDGPTLDYVTPAAEPAAPDSGNASRPRAAGPPGGPDFGRPAPAPESRPDQKLFRTFRAFLALVLSFVAVVYVFIGLAQQLFESSSSEVVGNLKMGIGLLAGILASLLLGMNRPRERH